MIEEAISIGGLRGIRHRPAYPDTGGTAVVLQGFFTSTHVGPARLYVQIGRILARRGLEVIRMDCYGIGDSDGDFEEATYESQLRDYRAMVEGARGRGIVLVGHSLGTSMAIRLAVEHPVVEKLILISPSCGPLSHPENMFSAEQRAELAARGETWRKCLRVRKSFLDAIESEDIYAIARRVEIPTLVLRGAEDEYYDGESVRRLQISMPRARLVEVRGADHNFLLPVVRKDFLRIFSRESRTFPQTSPSRIPRKG